jgi:hypothetical protein
MARTELVPLPRRTGRIGRSADRPADHQQAGAGGDRLGGGHHPGLVAGGAAARSDAWGDEDEGLRMGLPQGRHLQG